MKYLVNISRVIVGILFIISGFVKLNDPLGFSYKLQDYFAAEVLNLEFLSPYALGISVIVVVFEVVIGVFLLLGYKPKFTVWSLLIMIVFFTFLTGYTYLTGYVPQGASFLDFSSWQPFNSSLMKVQDCGCFGDALKLTPLQSFNKDLVLLVLILILFFGRKHIKPLFTELPTSILALLSFLVSLWFGYHVLMHLPAIDFRAYKIGANIQEGRAVPENAPKPILEYTWTFNVNGEDQEFVTNGSYPKVDGEYIGVETKTIEEGYIPPIQDFSIESEEEDLTEYFLEVENLVIIAMYNINKGETEGKAKLKAFSEDALKKGYTVIGLTSSGPDDKSRIKADYNLNFDFYLCDEKVIKTIVRANPGIVILNKGTVVNKAHWNDIEDITLETLPNASANLDIELKKELDAIYKTDQGIRQILMSQDSEEQEMLAIKNGIPVQDSFQDYFPLSKEIDSSNMLAIEKIIAKHGYPGKSLVGEPTNKAAFYVIQHSNKISKYLEVIKSAAKEGELPMSLAAMMEDRLLMYQGKPQIYGTQGRTLFINEPNQQSFIWPIADFENVNKRRQEAGFTDTVEENAKRLFGEDFEFKNVSIEDVDKMNNH